MEYGYRQIANILRARITDGTYAPGTKLPPERELCREWAVERTTLRRALNLLVEDGLIVKRVGYGSVVVEPGERELPLIAFITSAGKESLQTPESVFAAFSRRCADAGYRTERILLDESSTIQSLAAIAASAAGLVIADNLPHDYLDYLRERRLPCILMSQQADDFCSVLCNNESGMTKAVEHLASLRHHHIAYLGGDKASADARARKNAFLRAIQNLELSDSPPYTDYCGWTAQDGYRAMEQLLTAHPEITAVCTVNDPVAYGAAAAVRARGLRVPEDIALVGFGNTATPDMLEVSLTTVNIPPERLADELWQALAYELEHPYIAPGTTLVEAHLLTRDTTGPRKG